MSALAQVSGIAGRHCYMAVLLMLPITAALASDSSGVLDSRRLFFTAEQRAELTAAGLPDPASRTATIAAPVSTLQGATVNSLVDENKVKDVMETVKNTEILENARIERQGKPAVPKHQISKPELFFTGFLGGVHQLSLMINGYPCRPVFADQSGHWPKTSLIVCVQLADTGIKLQLEHDTTQLLVFRPGFALQRLAIGQHL